MLSDLRDPAANYPGFLSAYQYFQKAREKEWSRRQVREHEDYTVNLSIYEMALHNYQNTNDGQLPDLWDTSKTGDLEDMIATLQWQLLKLECSEDAANLLLHWEGLEDAGVEPHYTRFVEDCLRLEDAADEKKKEWKRLKSRTKEEVEEEAVTELQNANRNVLASEVEGKRQSAWTTYVAMLDNMADQADTLNAFVSKVSIQGGLESQLKTLARTKVSDWETIEAIAKITVRGAERAFGRKTPTVSPHERDEDMYPAEEELDDEASFSPEEDEKALTSEEELSSADEDRADAGDIVRDMARLGLEDGNDDENSDDSGFETASEGEGRGIAQQR